MERNEQVMAKPVGCEVCDGTGWVCENHQDQPWGPDSKRADACPCGAGAPCICNGGGQFPEGTRVTCSVYGIPGDA